MSVGIEVKPDGGYSPEAVAQLGVWMAAGFTHLRELRIEVERLKAREGLLQRPSANDIPQSLIGAPSAPKIRTDAGSGTWNPPPMIGLTIVGHEWSLYIGVDIQRSSTDDQDVDDDGDEARKVVLYGPILELRGGMRTLSDLFRLLDLMKRIKPERSEEHWPKFLNDVFQPLLNSM